MKSFEATIKDKIGIHARPASVLVNVAKEFVSDLKIEVNGKNDNARDLKSIMNIMSLGVKFGDVVKITAEGKDEELAISKIKETMETSNLI